MSRGPQIEVITGVERRRRFTDDEKIRIIEESLAPGGSIVVVAKRHDISPRLIYMWKSRLKRSGLLLPSALSRKDEFQASGFVQAATVDSTADSIIRIHIDEKIIADFPVFIDPRHLAAVVQALRQ